MANYNKVIIAGNLTRDPELRFTPQGASVCDMSIAINRVYKGTDGSQKEETCFVDVVAWGKQAETCAEYLKKGSNALVEGRLTLSQWETNEGKKRSKLRVTAERVIFLPGGQRSNSYSHSTEEQDKIKNEETYQDNPSVDVEE